MSPIAIITIALPLDGPATVASTGITPAHTLPLARAINELQAQLLNLAPAAAASPEPELHAPAPEETDDKAG